MLSFTCCISPYPSPGMGQPLRKRHLSTEHSLSMHSACGSQKTLDRIQSFLAFPRRISALCTGILQGEFKWYLQIKDCLISAPGSSRFSTCLGSWLTFFFFFPDCPCSNLLTSWSQEARICFTSVTLIWKALTRHLFLREALPQLCLLSCLSISPRAVRRRTRWSLASPAFLEAI